MRLLFVSKREPQQRDLISRPYGRFHHLPTELAQLGHDVHVALVSHNDTPAMATDREGLSVTAFNPRQAGIGRTLHALDRLASEIHPDWIIGCSDTWYGWLAQRLARRTGALMAVDAYDNYEAYMPWNFPLHWQWRKAVRAADVVTAAGPQLAALLDLQRAARRPVDIVPMAADPGFISRDRNAARAQLNLPQDVPLIGYFGGWARNRGTDVLLEALRIVRERQPEVRLVLTGKPPEYAASESGVLALGYLEDSQLPLALSSLDAACVITADSSFGRYSYPSKLCEAMACQVPVVATATEPVRWMLKNDKRSLATVGDAMSIATQLCAQLREPHTRYGTPPSWKSSARTLEAVLSDTSVSRGATKHNAE